MDFDKKVKLMLIKLNKQGHDVSLIKEHRYSRETGNIYTKYKLTFWYQDIKINKRTKEEKLVWIPNTIEFNSVIDLLMYMVSKAGEGDE